MQISSIHRTLQKRSKLSLWCFRPIEWFAGSNYAAEKGVTRYIPLGTRQPSARVDQKLEKLIKCTKSLEILSQDQQSSYPQHGLKYVDEIKG